MKPKQRRQAIQALKDAADSLMKSVGSRKRKKKPRGTPDFKTTDEMLEYAMRHKGERDVPALGIRYRGTTSDSEIPDTFGRVWASTVSARDLGRIDPKKFYVVIPFSDEYGKKEMADLSNGVLDGVLGISEKHEIIMQWYGIGRDAILVMDADKLTKINKLSRVQYDNPEYLVSNGMAALYRIFDKKRDKSGSYGLAGNLIDHILSGTKPGKKPGGDILSEAKDLAGTIEKHAEELRRSLKALPFEDKDDLRQAVRSVSNRMDKDDIEDFAKFSEKAVKNLTEFSTSYDGLSARLIKLYLDSDYEMEPGERIREAAALAPKAEATALDWGWDATQTEALVKVMTDFATLVQDFDAIKALSKKGSSEVASLSGDGAISKALSYDRGRALEKSFSDNGTDDIKTVKGLAKRVADVFKDGGHNYKDIPLTAWERAIRKGLKSIGNTFADEGEWLVKDKKLKIPSGSTLFVPKDEAVTPTLWDKEPVKNDRFDQMIKKYDLDKRYKVQRIDKAKFDKARSLYLTSPKKVAASISVAASALLAAHKAVAEALAFVQADAFDPAKPLKPSDVLTVYHGTSLGNVVHFINGFDATTVQKRYYNGPKHRGIFVAPTPEWARKFGDVVLEIDIRAKNLHGTDYSGRTGRERPERETTWKDRHQGSFRPYLSQTLSQSAEPQALLIGLVSPKQIKRVLYKGQWYTRQKFLDLKLKTTPAPKPGRSFSETEVSDLGIDIASTKYNFDQFLGAVAKLVDVDLDRAKSTLASRAAIPVTNGRDALLELLERLFEPTAAKAYAKKFRTRLQESQ